MASAHGGSDTLGGVMENGGQCFPYNDDPLGIRVDRQPGQRFSSSPLPSKMAGMAFSIRAVRVADCLAAAKWYK